jgi:outer membrane protein OmpA-like peptidoglycan-associated protein
MMKTFLKSSTTMLMGLSLALPGPVLAQSGEGAQVGNGSNLPPCVNAKGKAWKKLPNVKAQKKAKDTAEDAAARNVQCVINDDGKEYVFMGSLSGNGVLLQRDELIAAMLEQGIAEAKGAAPEETAEADATAEATAEAEAASEADTTAETGTTAEAETTAEADATAQAEAQSGGAAEADADATQTTQDSAQANGDSDAAADAAQAEKPVEETAEAAQGDAQSDAQQESAAGAQSGDDAQAVEELPQTTDEVTDAAKAELDQAMEAAKADKPEGEGGEAAQAEAQAEAEAEAQAETQQDAATSEEAAKSGDDAQTATDLPQVTDDVTEAAEAELKRLMDAAKGETPDEATETAQADEETEVQQEDTAASTGAANATVEAQAAAAADAESDSEAEDVEVETETVTEADARSSDEDFSTTATAKAPDEKKGLSDFEKFAIGAIGAAAVGAILNNGNKVVSNSGDRVVVQRQDGEYQVLKDDNVLLRRPGVEVRTERFDDGSSRETVTRPNGSKVITIKAANGQVLRRVRVRPDGQRVVLIDDTTDVEPVRISDLPRVQERVVTSGDVSAEDLRLALAAQENAAVNRRFSLRQIRQIRAVRELVPVIELDAVTFDTDSAAIRASEAEELRDLGVAMRRMIDRNPHEVFLVEGHTDAVGSATYNLALSDRRAESVALALTEYFDVPPENMVVQGYGESNLKIRTSRAERENRRATVRRITTLLQSADAR